MAQLNFEQNRLPVTGNPRFALSQATVKFIPFLVNDSISFATLNMQGRATNTSLTLSMSIGLYSLTGSTLSIANSISGSFAVNTNNATWLSFTATSATQNITPGNWWFGFLASTSNGAISVVGWSRAGGVNNFPGSFIGGRMTDTTNALPSSQATSDLDIAGTDATSTYFIILSA